MIEPPQEFDSVFRYIVVVSQRAEQLINGARARAESRHAKPTLAAKDDVDAGLVSIAASEGNDPDLRVFRRNIEKPILFSVIGSDVVMARITEELRRIGYPVFPFMRKAMIVLQRMYQVSRVIRQE